MKDNAKLRQNDKMRSSPHSSSSSPSSSVFLLLSSLRIIHSPNFIPNFSNESLKHKENKVDDAISNHPIVPTLFLVITSLSYELSALLLLPVLSSFYFIITEHSTAHFTRSIVHAVLVTTLISAAKTLKTFAASYAAIKWRQRVVSALHSAMHRSEYVTFRAVLGVENADQRVTQDADRLTKELSQLLSTLVATPFIIIFYTCYLAIKFSLLVPIACYLYFMVGSSVAYFQAKKIVPWVYQQEKCEGDFRHCHMLFNTHQEGIFFLRGGKRELSRMQAVFLELIRTIQSLICIQLPLNMIVNWFSYFGSIVNYMVIGFSILYLKRSSEHLSEAERASLMAAGSYACLYLISAFSTLLSSFEGASEVAALALRVVELLQLLRESDTLTPSKQSSSSHQHEGAVELPPREALSVQACDVLLEVRHVNICVPRREIGGQSFSEEEMTDDSLAPLMVTEETAESDLEAALRDDSEVLIPDLQLEIVAGMKLLIVGPSGCGKTTIMKYLAGFRCEEVDYSYSGDKSRRDCSAPESSSLPAIAYSIPDHRVLFLPQETYIVEGSLEDNVCYPNSRDERFDEAKFNEAMEDSGLDKLRVLRESHGGEAVKRMSGGQQQRLNFARAIYSKALLVCLDEQTSCLDQQAEDALYSALAKHCSTYISIGHRDSLRKHHTHILSIDAQGRYRVAELENS